MGIGLIFDLLVTIIGVCFVLSFVLTDHLFTLLFSSPVVFMPVARLAGASVDFESRMDGGVAMGRGGNSIPSIRIRTEFPETWIWNEQGIK